MRIVSEEELVAEREELEKKKAAESVIVDDSDPEEENDAEDIEADFVSGLTTTDVQDRTDDIEQLCADFILSLIGAEDFGVEELGFDSKKISDFMDVVEDFLAKEGILVYRPVVVKDEDGTMHIAYSQYDDELHLCKKGNDS